MNILVDYIGHADLFFSMHVLFEKRLGHKLFRPLNDKSWKAAAVSTSTLPDYAKLSEQESTDDLAVINMGFYDYKQKAISFQNFLDTQIDIMVTTSQMNEDPFLSLVKKYKPNTKVVRQIANIHEQPGKCKNILLSTLEPMPKDVNFIKYIPEHRSDFSPRFSRNFKIKSYSNYLTSYPEDLQNWRLFEKLLPEFTFRMHGGKGEHRTVFPGVLHKSMQDSMFIWHTKATGSCGYVLRQALSCGKPCIVRKDYAKVHNTLAQDLLIDGINCIDIDPKVRSTEESVQLIKEWSEEEKYKEIYDKAVKSYLDKVNFSKESADIDRWLQRLTESGGKL